MQRELRLLLSAAILALAGCGGGPLAPFGGDPAALPEFRHYQQALGAQHAAGMRVLDRLAGAERRLLVLEAGTRPGGFDPDGASSLLGIGDPPRTAALRRALETLESYNQAMTSLGMGMPEAQITAGLALAEGVLPLLPPAGAGAGTGFGRLLAATRQALPVLALSRTGGDRARLRGALTAATPRIAALLQAMRAATPAIYQVLRAGEVVPGNLADTDGIPPAGRARLDADRRMLAGWVLLIDQTAVAVAVAARAAESGGRADASALIATALRLRALADAIGAASIE